MPVTLADIARELRVSKMTVSRAINDNHHLARNFPHALASFSTDQRIISRTSMLDRWPR